MLSYRYQNEVKCLENVDEIKKKVQATLAVDGCMPRKSAVAINYPSLPVHNLIRTQL